ncbi:MAG TPA: hypothetical protein VHB79_02900 [Polyangiaceae bacterium]|nr:hypothetical protein [Polyangiaceae bacterium]
MSFPGNPSGAAALRVARAGSEALEKLKRGELTVEQYIEDRVERALSAVPVPLSAEQRETVRETLRFQVATDPVVAQYAQLTTIQASKGTAR